MKSAMRPNTQQNMRNTMREKIMWFGGFGSITVRLVTMGVACTTCSQKTRGITSVSRLCEKNLLLCCYEWLHRQLAAVAGRRQVEGPEAAGRPLLLPAAGRPLLLPAAEGRLREEGY